MPIAPPDVGGGEWEFVMDDPIEGAEDIGFVPPPPEAKVEAKGGEAKKAKKAAKKISKMPSGLTSGRISTLMRMAMNKKNTKRPGTKRRPTASKRRWELKGAKQRPRVKKGRSKK